MRVGLLAAIMICVSGLPLNAQPSKMSPLPDSAGIAAGPATARPASLTVEVPVLAALDTVNARVTALEPRAPIAAVKARAARVEPLKKPNATLAKIDADRSAAVPLNGADLRVSEIESPIPRVASFADADTQPRKMNPEPSPVVPVIYVSLQPGKMSPGIPGLTGAMRYAESPWLDHAINDLGTNPTGWKRVWCARSMTLWLQKSGKRGCPTDAAISCLEAGRRLPGPRIGAIAVLKHHVGIVKEIHDRHVVLVSGNNRGRPGARKVGISRYARASIVGYVWPE